MRETRDPALLLALMAVLAIFVAGSLAILKAWGQIGPTAQRLTPFPVLGSVTPDDARAGLAPTGGRIGADGRLTILEVPPTPGTPEPRVGQDAITDERPREVREVPNAMRAGIKSTLR